MNFSKEIKPKNLFNLILIIVFGYFFYLMLDITLKYIPYHPDVAFLQIKQDEVTNVAYYLPIFYVHVYSSIFVLIAGFTQFSNWILKKHKRIHRNIGKLYVFIVLIFSAPSGIIIGIYANGGLPSKIAFILLGILWWLFTFFALTSIKNKNINAHKNFMLRSFALCFSAITLRLWKVIIVYLFAPPMDVYQIIAWLGWIPNLIFIEILIRKKQFKL